MSTKRFHTPQALETAAGTVNYDSLSDSEIQRAKTLLHDAEKALSELNAAIIALITQRDIQVQHVQKYRVALAPHKRLPHELLSKIFVHCLPSNPIHIHAGTIFLPPRIEQAPWVLGQVCTGWRNISRLDPRLWHLVKISIYDKPSLHLSRACKLLPPVARLAVTYCGPANLLSTALIPHLWRIHDLNLRMGATAYDELFRSVSPTDFLTLQSAGFNVVCQTPEEPHIQATRRCGIFGLANKFKWLKVQSDSGFPISPQDIPFSQMTSLDISGVQGLDTDMVLSILRDCPYLEHLDVSFSPNELATTEPLYFSHLQSLRVHLHLPPILQNSHIWENLSSLNLLPVTTLDSYTLYIVLKQSINLTELHCPTPEKGVLPKSVGNLPFPKLRKLFLKDLLDNWLLESLIVPSLKELHMQSTRAHLNPCAIHNMLSSSGSNLLSIWFQSTCPQNNASPHGLQSLLKAFPSLTHLDDAHSMLDETTLNDIASGVLLPQLEFLRCRPVTEEAFLGMVEARAALPLGKTRPPRTLRQAFGVAPTGIRLQALEPASQSRLETLRVRYGLICSLYPSISDWDDHPD